MATGEKVRRRTVETRDELTPQESQIARLARDGLSNPEIGARLFLSPRTVEWHLHKVFAKLGIGSRKELRTPCPVATETPRSSSRLAPARRHAVAAAGFPRLSQPWKDARSPASQASRNPGAATSQSRSLTTMCRSAWRWTETGCERITAPRRCDPAQSQTPGQPCRPERAATKPKLMEPDRSPGP